MTLAGNPPPEQNPEIETKKSVSVNLDAALIDLLDALAAQQKTSRSNMANQLLGLAAQEQRKIRSENEEKKVTLSVRVKKSISEHLKNLAKLNGESVNLTAAYAIESAIEMALEEAKQTPLKLLREQLEETLLEAIAAQQEEIKKQAHRHAHLISRSILENLQNRQIMFALLQAQGVSNDEIQALSERALTRSVAQLKNPKPMMREALSDLLTHHLKVVNVSENEEEEDAQRYISELEDADYRLEKDLEIYRDVPDAYEIPEFRYLKNQQQVLRGKIAAVEVKLYELEHFESDDDEEDDE